ncbi:pyridoxamine kinase, partial [Ethanoligenens sp.]|uniref:pyridoxamine kinase n=1 Tax=Ethanoligenens sp. TaxID=2099655 RepID=UPI0039E86B4F
MQKHVAAIHDISGMGKCSLTVALPILSAAGVCTSIMPTAVLSTHTGGFTGFTYRDLTDDLLPFAEHWKSLNVHFDALYSGFLGSFAQLAIVSQIFDLLRSDDTLVMVDPVMADNGKLYSVYTPDFPKGMAKLCAKAGLIVPNMTEAAFLLNEPYREGPYDSAYVQKTLRALASLGASRVVLTGIWFGDEKLGAACYDQTTDTVAYAFNEKIEGYYHGTGDVFGSALLSGLM